MKLASRFGRVNQIRRDRPLTHDELMQYVPSVFGENKHESRSERYTYIPTITLLDNLQREGFHPFFACQTRVRDVGKREHTKHMLRLRREDQINRNRCRKLFCSTAMMVPVLIRCCGAVSFCCCNGLVCGESFGEVRVPHKGNVVEKVIEGAMKSSVFLTS